MEQKNNFYPLKGYIFEKGEIKSFPTANGDFRVREFKLELRSDYNGKEYKELVDFKLIQDKVNLLDYVEIGDEVDLWFTLGGKYQPYKDKTTGEQKKFHRNELKVMSMSKVVLPPDHPNYKPGPVFSQQNPNPKTNQVPVPAAPAFGLPQGDDDDLPF